MKILQVCPYDLERPGGVQAHCRELSEALRARGHQVDLLGPDWRMVLPWRGTQIDLGAWRPRPLTAYDLAHFHTPWNPAVPWQLLAHFRGPRVATFHDAPGGWTSAVMPRLGGWLVRRFFRAAIAVSPVAAHSLRHVEHHVIPNGIWWDRFQVGAQPRRRLLFLSRLEPRKGASVLLEAFARLHARHPDLELVMAGDGPLRARLQRQARGLPVRFPGRVAEPDKPALFASSDIFCSPALGPESFGIVLLEAMAAGVPAVGAANPGYRTVLGGWGEELLVPPGCPRSLAERLEQLLAEPERRQRLGRQGREEARRFDWSHVAEQVEAVYWKALG